MKSSQCIVITVSILLLIGITTAIEERTYITEETAIPFEVFAVLVGVGILFLLCAYAVAFTGSGGLTIILGILSTMFLAAATFAAPTTGFYSYVSTVNATTNSTEVVPVVWLALQPWMMWLLWGVTTLAFLSFVLGILVIFKEAREAEEMDWL